MFYTANFKGESTFGGANFKGGAFFAGAKFRGQADFYNSEFYGKTYFSGHFNGKTIFNYVLFEGKEKVIFDVENLSNVSFMNTDITGVRFSDKTRWGNVEYDKFWGGKKVKKGKFKISDERLLEERIKQKQKIQEEQHKPAIENEPIEESKTQPEQQLKVESQPEPQPTISLTEDDEIEDKDEEVTVEQEEQIEEVEQDEEKDGDTIKDFNLGSIKAVYRNLRENYEYRMRYDEAGQFFIREMELKRKYREVVSTKEENSSLEIKQNNWFRRNLFSLTGWYYHLSRYGESIWRPTVAGIVIVFLSTLFWLIQIDPSDEPSFTNTVGLANATKITVWQRAFERSMADFLPLLSIGGEVKVGLIDYIIKIVGGAVTFGLIAIALRRRFERRYRH